MAIRNLRFDRFDCVVCFVEPHGRSNTTKPDFTHQHLDVRWEASQNLPRPNEFGEYKNDREEATAKRRRPQWPLDFVLTVVLSSVNSWFPSMFSTPRFLISYVCFNLFVVILGLDMEYSTCSISQILDWSSPDIPDWAHQITSSTQ